MKLSECRFSFPEDFTKPGCRFRKMCLKIDDAPPMERDLPVDLLVVMFHAPWDSRVKVEITQDGISTLERLEFSFVVSDPAAVAEVFKMSNCRLVISPPAEVDIQKMSQPKPLPSLEELRSVADSFGQPVAKVDPEQPPVSKPHTKKRVSDR